MTTNKPTSIPDWHRNLGGLFPRAAAELILRDLIGYRVRTEDERERDLQSLANALSAYQTGLDL